MSLHGINTCVHVDGGAMAPQRCGSSCGIGIELRGHVDSEAKAEEPEMANERNDEPESEEEDEEEEDPRPVKLLSIKRKDRELPQNKQIQDPHKMVFHF